MSRRSPDLLLRIEEFSSFVNLRAKAEENFRVIVVRTPFRLPIGGGGTDLPSYYQKHGGFLITAAINKYMFININQPKLVDKIKLNYSQVEVVSPNEVHKLKHEVARETLRHLGINRPLEISSMADLSAGTGLGSSSSYTVGLINGINAMLRRHISTQELAEEACKVEIELIGKPIGKQDQYAAAYGGITCLEIDPEGRVKAQPLKLDPETIFEVECQLMMFYTNITRDANDVLAEQSQKVKVDEKQTTEAMHYIKRIGIQIKDCLLKGEVEKIGPLMHDHWVAKKKVSTKMSTPWIDQAYDLAMKNGATGGKLMGAGGGGFLLFACQPNQRKTLINAMEGFGLKYMDFRFDWEGSKVLVNL